MEPHRPDRLAVVGIHGHGAKHVEHALELQRAGRARLVAVVDPRAPGPGHPGHDAGVAWFPTFGDLLSAPGDADRPDVVVLSTPIPTHLPLARAAMEAGMDVLLEKPTTASLAEHTELVAIADRTGRRVQVGFQTFGSHALPAAAELVARGEIGDVVGIGAVGTWIRTAAYWARAPWAGRRRLDGRDVVDGVVTNPLAHAVATALRVGGATTAEDVAWVDTDLYRANPIEADDTSSVRVVGGDGRRYGFGLTLCAAERTPARVLVLGTRGELELEYEHDRLRLRTDHLTMDKTYGRTPLLDDLLDARADGSRPLLCDVRDTGAFMRVLEAVRTGADPTPLPDAVVEWHGEGDDRHPVVRDVAHWCERVARTQQTFSELGAPWTA
ncbi:Gfo/Idh/MocA family protein [Isoptericola variabilis]|uniref:Oxidoreductase domain protein n=1 Tax=Isoptericola variabilis (strain 225) TaxID=743718 RepID=F6FUP1_ISOV2|nr:Gfo/Idh/MocA family oxidoreductase [Isoptericola variabilis]AEG43302.1 oxidoreductase domain protein [Isoptericola variabilis 225]TWH35237.1 putative dehydrogenase [Isoptericola variabilis J7]